MVRTVDGSLLDGLLLTSLLRRGRSLLIVSAWAGGALLATTLLRGGRGGRGGSNSGIAVTVDLSAMLLDLLEAIGERDLHAVDGRAAEVLSSFVPVDLFTSAIVEFTGRHALSQCHPGDG
jgi:hypothetical protein